MKWSLWFPCVRWRELRNRVARGDGLYEIRYVRKGKPVSIPRFKGSDNRGLLYVGRARHLRDRIAEFLSAAERGTWWHSGGLTFFNFYRNHISLHCLEFRWLETKPHRTQGYEERLLIAYRIRFLDGVPLNITYPRFRAFQKSYRQYLASDSRGGATGVQQQSA
jgi:hypothetical protein